MNNLIEYPLIQDRKEQPSKCPRCEYRNNRNMKTQKRTFAYEENDPNKKMITITRLKCKVCGYKLKRIFEV